MNREDFVTAVRQGGVKFRADNIVITTGAGELKGKGLLEVADGRFRLHVSLSKGNPGQDLPNGITMQREFWPVRGVIEDEISFGLRSLPSNYSRNYTYGLADRLTLEFSAGHIELAPIGFDNLTSREVLELQQRASGQPDAVPAEGSAGSVRVVFHAVLPNFKLIEHNGGTETKEKNAFLGERARSSLDTFHGEMGGWEYGLVERDGDLHVHFLSKPEHQSSGEEEDWRLFYAFLNAIAFAHAQHAWPFSVEHRRDGKLIKERIQVNKGVADSPHAPFSARLAFNNLTKALSWSFGDVLEKAYGYFSGASKVAREVETLLFIFREATSPGIPKRIALLSLCSLLESLVRVVYEEEIEPKMAREAAEFQQAKKEVCEYLNRREQPCYRRLAAILANADPVNIRMRFDAAVEHLGLKPADKWQELHGLWSKFRNPMSHRLSKGDESEEAVREELIAESRLAGAINCMILKLMNYSGYVRLSVYEDKYGQI